MNIYQMDQGATETEGNRGNGGIKGSKDEYVYSKGLMVLYTVFCFTSI